MNTLEQTTETGSGEASAGFRSRPDDALSVDDQLRATPLQVARWCAGWLVLGLGGWGAVITLGWLASDGFGGLVP